MAEVIHIGNNERLIKPEGSAGIYLRRKDPYGFWYIHFERGVVPEDLSNAYTTLPLAQAAVEHYLENSSVRKRAAKLAE